MSSPYEKLFTARQLVMEAEEILIKEKKFCPYEIASILRNLDTVMENFKSELS